LDLKLAAAAIHLIFVATRIAAITTAILLDEGTTNRTSGGPDGSAGANITASDSCNARTRRSASQATFRGVIVGTRAECQRRG